MARGTPQFFTGIVNSTQSNTILREMFTVLDTTIRAYQSNGTDAWEAYETINATPGSQDIVYRSVGDRTLASGAGDAALFIRVTQQSTNDMRFLAYQDWSTASSTGSNVNATSQTTWLNLNEVSGFQYWCFVNEYEYVLLIKQGNFWHYVHFGSPIRSHIPAAASGIAFTTAAATAGSNVTVNLDRDISSSIRDSTATGGAQLVWIYNLTPAAAALRSATIELATVQTITSTSITFQSLSNSFDSGAIVGLDPSPMFVCREDILSHGGNIDVAQLWTNSIAGTYTSAGSQVSDYEYLLVGTGAPTATPSVNGITQAARAAFFPDQTGQVGFRGISQLIAFARLGYSLDGDFFRPDFSTANQYVVFPSLTLVLGGPALMLGPGAT